MRIDILTIYPKLLKSPFEHSILQRAIDKKIVEIRFTIYAPSRLINTKKWMIINLEEVQEWLCVYNQ